jgi:hypothetical protein
MEKRNLSMSALMRRGADALIVLKSLEISILSIIS